jgi:hypothetical protein
MVMASVALPAFLAILCNVIFIFSAPAFIPSARLKPLADVSAVAVALLFAVFFSRDVVARVQGDRSFKGKLRGAFLALFTPFFIWAMLQEFFAGPLSYLLHRFEASPSEYSTRELVVVRADDFGGRRCRNRALLEGSENLIWKPTLCGIPRDAVVKLRHGGVVKVQGTFTSYGIEGHYYALVGGA